MPVSTPSYFPPNRSNGSIVGITAGHLFSGARSFLSGTGAGNDSTINDIVILGDEAFSAGMTDTSADGTIAIGSNALKSQVSVNNTKEPNLAIGLNAAGALLNDGGNTFIGQNVYSAGGFQGGTHYDLNVVIGSNAAQFLGSGGGGADLSESVVIGANAMNHTPGDTASLEQSVVIGAGAGSNSANDVTRRCVIIGHDAAWHTDADSSNTVAIGAGISFDTTGLAGVFIGADITGLGNSTVAIGRSAGGADNSIAIGAFAKGGSVPGDANGDFNVVLGTGAGRSVAGVFSNRLIIEAGSASDDTGRRLIFGDFGTHDLTTDGGNLILGASLAGVNDDFPTAGLNTIKLLIGTRGSAPVTGGGYFWVDVNGIVNWSDETGANTTLVPSGGLLLTTDATLLDGAGSQVGTITNAPTAGNPAKWIEFMDGAQIRKIPTWI